MKVNLKSMKVPDEFHEFSSKLFKNIIKAEGNPTTHNERLSFIVKYFKADNEAYLNFVGFIVESQNV